MSLTGNQLIVALSQFIDDYWASVTTTAGSTTTLTDSALAQFGEKATEEAFVRLTTDSAVAGNLNQVRRVTTYLSGTMTVAPAFPQSVATAITYELHRYDPAAKFRALDRARILAFPQVAKIVEDETLTSDGLTTELEVPDSIRRGPAQVYVEVPLPPSVRWNIIPETSNKLTSITGWTLGANATASTYTRGEHDLIIPRLENSCLKVKTTGTSTLTMAFGATAAATYAGRKMTFGVWIYDTNDGTTVSILDDSTTTTSAQHQGRGWEFIQVSRDVDAINATTLTVRINYGSGHTTFAERAYFGNTGKIDNQYQQGPMPRKGVYRDDSHAILMLDRPAPRGFQYRLVGRTPVTALGTTLATQATNTMEVSETDQDLLLATAARILFTWAGMSTGELDQALPQISLTEQRFKELKTDWERKYPRMSFIDVI